MRDDEICSADSLGVTIGHVKQFKNKIFRSTYAMRKFKEESEVYISYALRNEIKTLIYLLLWSRHEERTWEIKFLINRIYICTWLYETKFRWSAKLMKPFLWEYAGNFYYPLAVARISRRRYQIWFLILYINQKRRIIAYRAGCVYTRFFNKLVNNSKSRGRRAVFSLIIDVRRRASHSDDANFACHTSECKRAHPLCCCCCCCWCIYILYIYSRKNVTGPSQWERERKRARRHNDEVVRTFLKTRAYLIVDRNADSDISSCSQYIYTCIPLVRSSTFPPPLAPLALRSNNSVRVHTYRFLCFFVKISTTITRGCGPY